MLADERDDDYSDAGSQRWIGCFLGVYFMGASATFALVLLLVVLGGNVADLWKPFVWALAWPIMWPLTLAGLVDL